MHKQLLSATVGLVFVPALVAQSVWNVPSGTPLGPTIAAASPGDILQLSGTYPGFLLDKGLIVRGPATIERSVGDPSTRSTHVTLPAGQSASFRQLDFRPLWTTLGGDGHRVIVDGSLSCEDCSFTGTSPDAALELVSGVLALQRCTVLGAGYGPGLAVLGGVASIVDSSVDGSDLTFQWGTAKPAVVVSGGELLACELAARGGRGGIDYGGPGPTVLVPGAPALVQTGGEVVVTDSVLTGGPNLLGAGGPAIHATGAVAIARTQLVVSANVSGPSVGYTVDDDLPGIAISGPLARGATVGVTAFPGAAQLALGLVGSLDLATSNIAPVVEPVFGLPGQQVLLVVATPPSGPLLAHFTIPNVPWLVGQDVWYQALELTAAGARGSAVVGGFVR